MAFIASNISLQNGFNSLLSVALQQKTYLSNWLTALNGNITALDGIAIVSSITQAITLMDGYVALPGMPAYAQAQFSNAGYDVATEYNNMRAALVAVRSWLQANLPANAVTVANGVTVGAVFAPAQTAPLKALVTSASATIA